MLGEWKVRVSMVTSPNVQDPLGRSADVQVDAGGWKAHLPSDSGETPLSAARSIVDSSSSGTSDLHRCIAVIEIALRVSTYRSKSGCLMQFENMVLFVHVRCFPHIGAEVIPEVISCVTHLTIKV